MVVWDGEGGALETGCDGEIWIFGGRVNFQNALWDLWSGVVEIYSLWVGQIFSNVEV
jgi:hypothetical protein